tara:strand:+ start:21 stop:476 length:456 start_codon:yes stop_codon:yes gene_type:complete
MVLRKGIFMNFKNLLISTTLCFLTIGCGDIGGPAGDAVGGLLNAVGFEEQEPYVHCSDSTAMNYFDDGSNVINEESCLYCGDLVETILERKYKCCRDPEAINAHNGTWSDGLNSYPFNPNTEDRQYCIYDDHEFEYFLTQLDSAGWDNIWD